LGNNREFEAARAICDEILARHPGTPLAENAEFARTGMELYLTGDFATALDRTQGYLDRRPRGLRVRDAQLRLEMWSEIVGQQDAVAADPTNSAAHLQLGYSLLRGRFLPQAEEHFLAALQDSTQEQALLGLGYTYMRWNRFDEGAQYMEKYLQRHANDGNVFNQVGYAYLGLGQLEKARDCFARYRDLEPDNPNSHDSYAECLMHMGQLEEAAAEYKKALELNPEFSNPYYMLGEVYSRMGNTAAALEWYGKYLERDPYGALSAQAQERVTELSQK